MKPGTCPIPAKKNTKRLRAGLMPASGPPAREGAEIETLDGQKVGTAPELNSAERAAVPKLSRHGS